MTEYSLWSTSVGSYYEKGSSFTARSFTVRSVNEIKSVLNRLKEEFQDASHICYAYRIKQGTNLDEFSTDSGEPTGSAGTPILNVLKRKDLVNSVIFVVRYFGGTKLGIANLVHAYRAAAEDAVEHATLKPWVQLCSLLLIYKYEVQKKVESVQKKYDANIIQQNFSGSVETIIEVRESICEEFIMQLEQITNGTIQINKV
jgi:uncharacterized YigZ family protein